MYNRQKIKAILHPIVTSAYEAESSDNDLRKNTLDVFSASIDSAIRGISFDEWLLQEKQRQVQKTLQNRIGELHQEILGTFDGVNSLGVGEIIDLKSTSKKFIAEIKNKHNTTKGNHKTMVYDDLEACLKGEDPDVIAYYVEVLPRNGKTYNEPFTPPDNVLKTRRPLNERIRRIDGMSFYTLASGSTETLLEIYKLIPELIAEILYESYAITINPKNSISLPEFNIIFNSSKE